MPLSKIRLGRLLISFSWLPQNGSKVKEVAIYSGVICDVCGERVKGGHKADHLMSKHPEYSFTTEHKEMSCNVTYICSICRLTVGGVAGVVRHYRTFHLAEAERILREANGNRKP